MDLYFYESFLKRQFKLTGRLKMRTVLLSTWTICRRLVLWNTFNFAHCPRGMKSFLIWPVQPHLFLNSTLFFIIIQPKMNMQCSGPSRVHFLCWVCVPATLSPHQLNKYPLCEGFLELLSFVLPLQSACNSLWAISLKYFVIDGFSTYAPRP